MAITLALVPPSMIGEKDTNIRKVISSFILLIVFSIISFSIYADTPTVKKLIQESVERLINKDANGAIEKLDQVLLLSPNHAEAYFRKGMAFFMLRKAKEGLDLIKKSTELDPKNVRYSLYLGRIYTKQGDLQKSMDEYERIIDTGTRDKRIKEIEKLFSLSTARSLTLKKETNAALLIYNGLLLEYPNDPQVLYSIANTYMELGRVEEAERAFIKLHNFGKKNVVVNFSLATIYEKTRRPKLAMKHLQLIRDQNLNDRMWKNATIQYYIIEGRLALDNQQWSAALKSLQNVVNIDPGRTEAFFNISMANLRLGNVQLAERGFLTVLRVTPNDFSARLNLGQMYYDIGKVDQAKEQLQYIIDNDKSKRYAAEAGKRLNIIHSVLADAALKSGNIELGMLEYEKALSFASANTKASFTRGMIFVKQNKFVEAQAEFESVIKFSPKNVQARINLGNIYERRGLFSKAAEQYEIIIDLDRNGKAGRFAASKWKITKGRGLWAEKRLTEAEKIFEQVVEEQPGNAQAFAFLGIMQSSKGKLRKAAASYQKVLDIVPANFAIKMLLGKVYEQLGLDSLAANEYRTIIFSGGRIPQVPEAEQRLAAVESRLSGFSNTLNYRFAYDSNINLNDANPAEEVRSDLALSFNYAMKTRDDLSFRLSWSPTYSTFHISQTDYFVSVLQSLVQYGSPNDNWNFAFLRQDQDNLVNDTSISQSTSVDIRKSKKYFLKPFLDAVALKSESETIATNVNLSSGFRHIKSFAGSGLESIMATLSLSLTQQLRWGINANVGYSLGIYRNLKFSERFGNGGVSVTQDTVTGIETLVADETLVYSSDDYEYNSHRGSVSLSRTIGPGLIAGLSTSGTFTGYVNPDSGAFTTGVISKRLNLNVAISPSITYLFLKNVRFVVSARYLKNLSNLPVGISGGFIGNQEDSTLEAIATFQSTSLGKYEKFSVDASFIMFF